MNEENITPEGQADGSQLNPAAPEGTVEGVINQVKASMQPGAEKSAEKTAENMTLSELNEALGKSFKDKTSAIKSLKDTFSYVGKKVADIKKEVVSEVKTTEATDKLAKELEEMRKERFYDKNPQFAEPAVRKLIERIGGSPSDVVNSEEFKTIFSKVSGYDESQKLRTVLESNPRLASSKDALTKARELQSKGATQGAARQEVERLAVSAVKDLLNM